MADPAARERSERRFGAPEAVAGGVTALWLVTAALLFPEGEGVSLLALVASVVPVVLVWVAVALLRTARALRAEAARLQGALDGLRQAEQARSQAAPRPPSVPEIERHLQALLAAQARVEAALGRVTAQNAPAAEAAADAPQDDGTAPRPALATPPAVAPAQPALALGPPDGAALRAPVTVPDFLRALNFPDTVGDAEGFRALRAGLADPRAARIIRAAQDVLTLLSEDGLYMDDLSPAPALPPPELWRRFARGARGSAVAGLAGVADPASLARAATRMREDAVFRDVAHHFLRHFDRMMEALEPNVTDADLNRLAETRSGRAFMLLGQVTGSFG